jgi:hypothetical protein
MQPALVTAFSWLTKAERLQIVTTQLDAGLQIGRHEECVEAGVCSGRSMGSVLTIQQIPVISGWRVIVFALLKSFYSAAHRHVMNAEMRADQGHSAGSATILARTGFNTA